MFPSIMMYFVVLIDVMINRKVYVCDNYAVKSMIAVYMYDFVMNALIIMALYDVLLPSIYAMM